MIQDRAASVDKGCRNTGDRIYTPSICPETHCTHVSVCANPVSGPTHPTNVGEPGTRFTVLKCSQRCRQLLVEVRRGASDAQQA